MLHVIVDILSSPPLDLLLFTSILLPPPCCQSFCLLPLSSSFLLSVLSSNLFFFVKLYSSRPLPSYLIISDPSISSPHTSLPLLHPHPIPPILLPSCVYVERGAKWASGTNAALGLFSQMYEGETMYFAAHCQ